MQINYQHKISRKARHLRLSVFADGRVVLTSPAGVPNYLIERFVSDKALWVRKKLEQFQSRPAQARRIFTKQDYIDNKARALELVHGRLAHWNLQYSFSYKKVQIKTQKTRWGSCSPKGVLSFNFKILFLPQELQDYIVVHELCHLKEMNHSKRFWALVALTFPNYIHLRKQLRKSGIQLSI